MWSEPVTLEEQLVHGLFTVTAFARLEPPSLRPDALGTRGPAPAAFATLDLRSFDTMLWNMHLGPSGVGFLLTPNGLVVASSRKGYSTHRTFGPRMHDAFGNAPPDDLLQLRHPLLLECGHVTEKPVTNLNATQVLTAKDSEVCQRPVRYRNDDYLLQVSLLSQADTALPWSVVLLTRDYDFYGSQLEWASVQLILATIGALLVAIVLVSVAARLLTRPIDAVVAFMADVARIAVLPASDSKQAQMRAVMGRWRRALGGPDQDPCAGPGPVPGLHRLQSTRTLAGVVSTRRVADQSALRQAEAEMAAQAQADAGGWWKRLRPFETHEVSVMQRSFGDLLRSWSDYDELEALNHSKRQFIRYIFHEVRLRPAAARCACRCAPRSRRAAVTSVPVRSLTLIPAVSAPSPPSVSALARSGSRAVQRDRSGRGAAGRGAAAARRAAARRRRHHRHPQRAESVGGTGREGMGGAGGQGPLGRRADGGLVPVAIIYSFRR
jgi:hypothetical protein